jgi:exonuclease SbcD
MNLIYTTDVHGRANNPISRLDDYPTTVLRKIDWVIDVANENDAYIACGGDLVNSPDTSPSFVGALAGRLSRLKKKPLYMVLGNHDIYGYNPDSFIRTPLFILECMGLIKIIRMDEPIYLEDEIVLTGQSSVYDIDKDKKYFYPKIDKKGCKHFHIAHSFLTNRPWKYVNYTLIDDILDTPADVVLSAHEHNGFGIIQKNGKFFCHPGALLRVSASVGDINKIVRISKFEVSDGVLKHQFINAPMEIALPWEEVIDRNKLEEEKEHNAKMQEFFANIAETDIRFDNVDLMEAFAQFATLEEMEPRFIEELTKRLATAMEHYEIETGGDDE